MTYPRCTCLEDWPDCHEPHCPRTALASLDAGSASSMTSPAIVREALEQEPVREMIARIIDPKTAELFDKITNGVEAWGEKNGIKFEYNSNQWGFLGRSKDWDAALAKADAIRAALAALDATPGEGVLMPREQLRDWYTQAFAMFVALTPEDDEDDRRTPKLMSEMEALLAPANPASEPVQ